MTWTVMVKPYKCPHCRSRHWNRKLLPKGGIAGIQSKKHLEKCLPAIRLKLQGKSYREIGDELGISRQRAQQLVEPTAGIRLIVRNRAGGLCEECKNKTPHGHLHHLAEEGRTEEDFNNPNNLKFLCTRCHQAEHLDVNRGANTKLTVDMVREIKKMIENKQSSLSISQHFGVSKWTIRDIKCGDTWTHVMANSS